MQSRKRGTNMESSRLATSSPWKSSRSFWTSIVRLLELILVVSRTTTATLLIVVIFLVAVCEGRVSVREEIIPKCHGLMADAARSNVFDS